MSLDIRPDHLKIVEEILKKHLPDREVWAFGSRVNGTAKETSDLDLVVIGENPLDFQTLGALRDDFSESNLPYKVDVVDWAKIGETFREIIRKDKIVIKKEGSSVSLDLPLKKLPFGWKEDRLDTIADFNPEQVDNKYPHILIQYLDISGISRGLVGNPELLALEEAPSRAKRIVRENDTIISTVRPGNRAYAFLKKVPNNLVVSTGFSVLRAKGCSPRFLYYLSTSDSIIDYLASIAEEKTAYPSVNPKDIAECRVFIPPLPEQRAIAHILGTLDDKIELNRRMNETLEAMAQAIFKSWFVDFDPVRAKMEGRPTGLPKEIEDLFPDSFEDSELGEIPRGWEVVPIEELATIVGGSTPSTKDPSYWNGVHNWATPKDLSTLTTTVLLETERKITDKGLSQIGSGQLPIGTLLLSSRAPIGYLAISEVPISINQGFIGMLPKNKFSNLFLLFWAKGAHEEIISRANGSTFLEISKSNFRSIPIVRPNNTIIEVFDSIIRPMYMRVVNNEKEVGLISKIRDSLLPNLLSGKIRLEEKKK